MFEEKRKHSDFYCLFFFIPDAITKDEVRCLRLIHLLFRVACPVVRMTFNHEIQPNQLRKTLDRNKALLAKLYRRTGNIINDFQWSLLFKGTY